jgi:dUTP pyrophosphatase
MSTQIAPSVKFALLDKNATPPKKGTEHSAGWDLYALNTVHIDPHKRKPVKTGVAHECPKDMVGMLCSRSGLATKEGIRLFFSPGIIDADYRGDITVWLENTNNIPMTIEKGSRIAQIVYVNAYTNGAEIVDDVNKLTSTDRGSNGFGSTGVK